MEKISASSLSERQRETEKHRQSDMKIYKVDPTPNTWDPRICTVGGITEY